jgi:hypothetical protein
LKQLAWIAAAEVNNYRQNQRGDTAAADRDAASADATAVFNVCTLPQVTPSHKVFAILTLSAPEQKIKGARHLLAIKTGETAIS